MGRFPQTGGCRHTYKVCHKMFVCCQKKLWRHPSVGRPSSASQAGHMIRSRGYEGSWTSNLGSDVLHVYVNSFVVGFCIKQRLNVIGKSMGNVYGQDLCRTWLSAKPVPPESSSGFSPTQSPLLPLASMPAMRSPRTNHPRTPSTWISTTNSTNVGSNIEASPRPFPLALRSSHQPCSPGPPRSSLSLGKVHQLRPCWETRLSLPTHERRPYYKRVGWT